MNAKKQVFELSLLAIVDDDSSFRRSILRLLRFSGLGAECFASAGAFLQSELLGQTDCLPADVCYTENERFGISVAADGNRRADSIVFLSAPASRKRKCAHCAQEQLVSCANPSATRHYSARFGLFWNHHAGTTTT